MPLELDFSKGIEHNLSANEMVNNFARELSNALKFNELKNSRQNVGEKSILEQIKESRNISILSETKIKEGIDKILTEFANETTDNIKERVIDMANDVLDKQDMLLQEYRKEGHIYMVSEKNDSHIFLWDMTDMASYKVEEVNFPKELLSKATEGTLFKFINGNYELFSTRLSNNI